MNVFAWLGGGLFAFALGYLVYFYLITLRITAGDPAVALRNTVIDTALFSAFALHHSIFARTGVKQRLAGRVRPGLERTLYVWVASLLALAMCVAWQPIPGMAYQMPGLSAFAGWTIQAGGAIIVVMAARVIDPLELAGVRQAAGRSTTSPLRIVGPFRVVRHPIYVGWILMVFGTPTMTMNRLVFAAVSTAYLILAIPWEEKSLVAVHGDHYRAYQQAVRWRVLPGIW